MSHTAKDIAVEEKTNKKLHRKTGNHTIRYDIYSFPSCLHPVLHLKCRIYRQNTAKVIVDAGKQEQQQIVR